MDYAKRFRVVPGTKISLSDFNPDDTAGLTNKQESKKTLKKLTDRLAKQQYKLYADANQSLLVVLQALDAGGKDGTIRKVFSKTNPQSVVVSSFKVPSHLEMAHDYLWRVHAHTPQKGQIGIFNRSHYEDVLVVRVHELVEKSVWSKRYDQINAFEALLTANRTRVLKFFLHISPEEQLDRFADRLNDPECNWKISESDYTERKLWPKYTAAYEDVLTRTSTEEAPWYIIPANHKWFRNVAIASIVSQTLDEMKLTLPPVTVDLEDIRKRYHAAKRAEAKRAKCA